MEDFRRLVREGSEQEIQRWIESQTLDRLYLASARIWFSIGKCERSGDTETRDKYLPWAEKLDAYLSTLDPNNLT